jgi:hypothetical protein
VEMHPLLREKKGKSMLTKTEQDVLDFLITPKTAIEVMEFVGHKTPPYGILRFLQRLDLVDKISKYERSKAMFVQSGRSMIVDTYVKETHNVFGVQI